MRAFVNVCVFVVGGGLSMNAGKMHMKHTTGSGSAVFETHLIFVDIIGGIHSDISSKINKLNEVNVKIRLMRNKDSFCLVWSEVNPTYKVKLINAVLLVRKVQLSLSGPR